jgi:putative transposase
VNHLVSTNANTLIVGYNKGWKQDIKMWKDDKQNFVYIPFLKFVQMLEYKCKLVGINVIIHEESYTSKTSFRYQDYIPTYNIDDHNFQPTGKRIERGLFKDKDGTIINADVNGSYNIMRKTLIENAAWNESIFLNCVEVCSTPLVKSF